MSPRMGAMASGATVQVNVMLHAHMHARARARAHQKHTGHKETGGRELDARRLVPGYVVGLTGHGHVRASHVTMDYALQCAALLVLATSTCVQVMSVLTSEGRCSHANAGAWPPPRAPVRLLPYMLRVQIHRVGQGMVWYGMVW